MQKTSFGCKKEEIYLAKAKVKASKNGQMPLGKHIAKNWRLYMSGNSHYILSGIQIYTNVW